MECHHLELLLCKVYHLPCKRYHHLCTVYHRHSLAVHHKEPLLQQVCRHSWVHQYPEVHHPDVPRAVYDPEVPGYTEYHLVSQTCLPSLATAILMISSIKPTTRRTTNSTRRTTSNTRPTTNSTSLTTKGISREITKATSKATIKILINVLYDHSAIKGPVSGYQGDL